MTNEQLEKLLRLLDSTEPNDVMRADAQLFEIAPSLARRVIELEKIVDAWFNDDIDLGEYGKIVNAYREASK